MINVNMLLSNSVRNELMGSNMFVFSKSRNPRYWNFSSDPRLSAVNVWEEPGFSMKGILGIGHQTNASDALTLEVYANGEKLNFHAVRNLWTPAFMETYYRCEPVGTYKRSGLVIIKEKKCISEEDVFRSELTVINDDNEPVKLEFRLVSCFSESSYPFFDVDINTVPRAQKQLFRVMGKLCVLSDNGYVFEKHLAPQESFNFGYSAAYSAKAPEKARLKCEAALKNRKFFEKCECSFNAWFEKNVPELKTDDANLLKIYYYRWFLIKKNTFNPKKLIPEHYIKGNAIYESSTGDWYGCPVGLPVAMQVDEAKWLKDKKIARDQLNNWKSRRGSYQGYIQYTPLAAWHFYLHEKDNSWLEKSYQEFKRYTFLRLDETDDCRLPITVGSWVTGAEYQPSFYQHTEIPWDYRYDNRRSKEVGGKKKRLYRLDEIMFAIGNIHACEKMAAELGFLKDKKAFSSRKKTLISILKERFWCKERGMFFDVDVDTGKRCDAAACYDTFAPLMWNLISGEEYEASVEKLFDSDVFFSEFSIPTAERHTPMFWPDNAIVGPAFASKAAPDFYGCCWNGPVWPFADTLAITALGDVAKRNRKYREKWLEMFENYTNLHYFLGDKSIPDIVEHYRHSDGTPFSVTHDYFHSCYIDPFMKYWAGISVSENGTVSFEPYTKSDFELNNVMICGTCYSFKQYHDGKKLSREIKTK